MYLMILSFALGGAWRRWMGTEEYLMGRATKVGIGIAGFATLYGLMLPWSDLWDLGILILALTAAPFVMVTKDIIDWKDAKVMAEDWGFVGIVCAIGLAFAGTFTGSLTAFLAAWILVPMYAMASQAWVFWRWVLGDHGPYTLFAEVTSGAIVFGASGIIAQIISG